MKILFIKKDSLSRMLVELLNKLLILKSSCGDEIVSKIVENQIDVITSITPNSNTKGVLLVIDIGNCFISELLSKYPDVHENYLYNTLKEFPQKWHEILEEFEKNSFEVDYGLFFTKLNEEVSKSIVMGWSDKLRSMYEKIYISDILVAKAVILEDFVKFILEPENLEKHRERFTDKDIFSVLMSKKLENKMEEYFKKYWDLISDKNTFINEAIFTNEESYRNLIPIFNTFSPEFKEELALNFSFGYRSIFGMDEHIYWIPKSKRLEYLKNKTPISNILCYQVFGRDGVLNRIGTKTEIIDFNQTKELVDYYINKYGRKANFVSDAVERFEDWVKNNPQKAV